MTCLRSHAADKFLKESSLFDLKKSERKTKSIFKRISIEKVGKNLNIGKGDGGRRLKGGRPCGKGGGAKGRRGVQTATSFFVILRFQTATRSKFRVPGPAECVRAIKFDSRQMDHVDQKRRCYSRGFPFQLFKRKRFAESTARSTNKFLPTPS